MDTPSKYFSSGNLVQNSGEVAKELHPNTSFSVWGGLFPPPTGIERVLAPLVLFSLKGLEDRLF
jgi:hypothetical protein